MASSCGIHIDHERYRLIALEGGAKKQKIVACYAGDIQPDENPIDSVATGLRRAVKENKLSPDSVGLAVYSGLAAFRTLTLPFDDRNKIEDVIKFEVENDLPQWDIDDVVVDFIVTNSKPGVESSLLITAVPKERLASQLMACEAAGLEPNEAELDGTALFNAANRAGFLDEEAAQVLVHVGDSTTVVVVVDGGRLAAMRAIRAGSRPHVAHPDAPEAPTEKGDEEAEQQEPKIETILLEDETAVRRRLEQSSKRIRRELGRTISGIQTNNPIEAVFFSGDPLPGLEGDVFDVPIHRLEAVPPIEGIDDPQDFAIAYGSALGQLGAGPIKAHLRREDLRYSGKFERLELPLAVLALLAFTLLAVHFIVVRKQISWRDEGDVGSWSSDIPKKGDMQIWLEASNAFMLPDFEAETPYPGRLKNPPEAIEKYARLAEGGEDVDRTKYEELIQIRSRLRNEINQLQKDLGQVSEIVQPQSALLATTLVLDVLDEMGEQVGRFAIRSLTSDYVATTQGQGDYVIVKLDIDFFAEDAVVATSNYSRFTEDLDARSWCRNLEPKSTKELENSKGIYIDGLTVHVDTSKFEEQGVTN